MPQVFLSERQQSTVAAAITLVCGVIIFAFVATMLWLMGWIIARFSTVILPLAVAAVLALMLKPYHAWVTRKVGGRPVLGVFLLYLSIGLPIALFAYGFGARISSEVSDLARQIPVWWAKAQEWLGTHLPALRTFWAEHQLGEKARQLLEEHGGAIFRGVGGVTELILRAWSVVVRWVTGLFGWVVLPVYLAFFLIGSQPLSRAQFEAALPFFKKETREDVLYLGQEFVNILVAFFRGQLVIGLLQGLLYAAGFSLVGLQYGFILGLTLGFLNIIPYLGSMVGLAVCLPMAFFQESGGFPQLAMVVGVFTLVQCLEAYVLTPRIMGNRTGLHPLVIMVAIFFWGSAFGGITGMILAIPLTAFLVIFWRLAKAKYIKAIV